VQETMQPSFHAGFTSLFAPFLALHSSARNHATRFSMFFSSSNKVKNILCMFCVAYVQCKHHVSNAQEGIAALIIGTALGTSLFLIGEKSPKSERAL
jgi:Na+/H+ antiporter NhaD/arsenite permease-like protein